MKHAGWTAGTIPARDCTAESFEADQIDALFYGEDDLPALEVPGVTGNRDELQVRPADKHALIEPQELPEGRSRDRKGAVCPETEETRPEGGGTFPVRRRDDSPKPAGSRSDRLTFPLLCAGICLIACCVLIPQADANRRVAYESRQLRADLESLRKQADVFDQFLNHVADDPNLAERLAQRQLKYVRQGTKVLQLNGMGEDEISPFHLLTVTPPPAPAPYQPRGGFLAGLCYNPHSRIYVLGAGLILVAVALVFGAVPLTAPRRPV